MLEVLAEQGNALEPQPAHSSRPMRQQVTPHSLTSSAGSCSFHSGSPRSSGGSTGGPSPPPSSLAGARCGTAPLAPPLPPKVPSLSSACSGAAAGLGIMAKGIASCPGC